VVTGECDFFDDLYFKDYESQPKDEEGKPLNWDLYPEDIPFYEKWKSRRSIESQDSKGSTQ